MQKSTFCILQTFGLCIHASSTRYTSETLNQSQLNFSLLVSPSLWLLWEGKNAHVQLDLRLCFLNSFLKWFTPQSNYPGYQLFPKKYKESYFSKSFLNKTKKGPSRIRSPYQRQVSCNQEGMFFYSGPQTLPHHSNITRFPRPSTQGHKTKILLVP